MLNYLLASNKEFEAVFSGYYTKLCRQAFFYLRSKEDAEDVVQELFIKLWHDRHGNKAFPQHTDRVVASSSI